MKDDELEKLLAPLRAQAPTEIEMRKWELTMARERPGESRGIGIGGVKNLRGGARSGLFSILRAEWLRLATALMVGFAIGALVFKTRAENTFAIEMASATFERSHANLD